MRSSNNLETRQRKITRRRRFELWRRRNTEADECVNPFSLVVLPASKQCSPMICAVRIFLGFGTFQRDDGHVGERLRSLQRRRRDVCSFLTRACVTAMFIRELCSSDFAILIGSWRRARDLKLACLTIRYVQQENRRAAQSYQGRRQFDERIKTKNANCVLGVPLAYVNLTF